MDLILTVYKFHGQADVRKGRSKEMISRWSQQMITVKSLQERIAQADYTHDENWSNGL